MKRVQFVLIALLIVMMLIPGAPAAASESRLSNQTQISGKFLSDGQFVYGPNVGTFDLKDYLQNHAPHLLPYADGLYERAEYFSINPKVYLTLLELHSHLISVPNAAATENPFGLNNGDFISQIESLSNKMTEAYYLHLLSYSPLPVEQRNLESFVTPNGDTINAAPDANAGTYAILAGLAAMDQQNIPSIFDNNQSNGFYQTYVRLFENDDPLDESNHIDIPGEAGALAASDIFLQLPFLQGSSWMFGGVHDNDGGSGVGTPLHDASAMDFFPPGGLVWGDNTSSMWVAASASGIPTKISNCNFSILHSGGWETTYYHLENIQNFSGTINQNDKIGVIANTLAEATCSGGSATGPHVHFALKHNGAFTAINGSSLSRWYVHAGRSNYDTDPNYSWIERAGLKKYPFSDVVLSEAPTVALTVSKAGCGTGTVTSDVGGINCGATCSTNFDSTTVITLAAIPDAGFIFAGWGGACSGVSACALTMDADKSVTANFTLDTPYTLNVSKTGTGAGTVTGDVGGINCGASCSANYNLNTAVTLTVTPDTGSTFTGWSGACAGVGACMITMDTAKSVTANFTLNTYALTVGKTGSGTGIVTSNVGGINCGASCSANFNYNTAVTLTATPATGSAFAGWSGACTGAGACTITMDADKSVTANFTPDTTSTYTLNVSKTGSGSGTVTSNVGGINCGAICSANFSANTTVTLTVAPDTGSTFTGWSGACADSGVCKITMNAAKSVTANFKKEYVKNRGFNAYSSSAPKIPISWIPANFTTSDGKSPKVKQEGAAAIKITGQMIGLTKTLTQNIQLSGAAGDSFVFSFWVMGSSIPSTRACRGQVLFYNGAIVKDIKTINCPVKTYAFQQKTLAFKTFTAYTNVEVKFTYSKIEGTVWFDAVSLLK